MADMDRLAEEATDKVLLAQLDRPQIYAAIRSALDTARDDGRLAGLAEAEKIAEGWKGRRLKGDYDDTPEDRGWCRGVDMAAHYIAAAIRAERDRLAGAGATEGT